MTRIAMIHPKGLIGDELKHALEQRRELWTDLKLLSSHESETGALAELAGDAAIVLPLEDDSLDSIDVAFFCGPIAANRPSLERMPPAATAIILSPDASPKDGTPLVVGANFEAATRGQVLLSPHPAAIALTHLLHPLLPFAPYGAVATLLQPISTHGKEALDEVLLQTRGILAFQDETPRNIFPTQLAFNAYPAEPAPYLTPLVQATLDSDFEISAQLVQVGVFHSFGISLYVTLDEDPGPETVRQALGDHSRNELSEEPEKLGPIDAAGRETLLVGPVEAAASGGYWIWAAMDNLTTGGADNAVGLLEALDQVTH